MAKYSGPFHEISFEGITNLPSEKLAIEDVLS